MEITAPVGSFESLLAAIQGGADSIYFGAGNLNMRSRSSFNFSLDDISEITKICKEKKLRTYLTLNAIIFDQELEEMKRIADAAKQAGVDAIIASDVAVLEYLSSIEMETHISTQCNITNIEAVKFYSRWANVMVTARELSLGQIKKITDSIREQNICGPSGKPVQIEIFAHGALCMAVSGKCYLSLHTQKNSANRGACYQTCRRSYIVKDKDDGTELEIENEYIMSPKDLCTIGFLDLIAQAGVSVLKIEGRGRSPEYVKETTACYHEAVNALNDGSFNKEKTEEWTKRLSTVFNRGFWDGYYLGQTMGEWSERYGSSATRRKIFLGKVTNYFSKLGVAEIQLETLFLEPGETVMIIGPSTGVVETEVKEIRLDKDAIPRAVKGDRMAMPVSQIVRKSDKVYKIVDWSPFDDEE
ncbi:MAG: peptidase U32 family protein [Bacteroidota bacterium]